MRHLLSITILSIFLINISYSQTDTLFKNENAPAVFIKLKYDEIRNQYSWNDTSLRIIDYFRKENSSSHFNLGASIGLLVLGPILIVTAFEQNKNDLGNSLLLVFVGFPVGITGVIGIPISLIEAKFYNKSNLYKVLRTYRLQGKVKKKYCTQINYD